MDLKTMESIHTNVVRITGVGIIIMFFGGIINNHPIIAFGGYTLIFGAILMIGAIILASFEE